MLLKRTHKICFQKILEKSPIFGDMVSHGNISTKTVHRLARSFGKCHAKMRLQAYADSEVLDHPAHSQSDQGLHSPLTESLDTTNWTAKAQRILCACAG